MGAGASVEGGGDGPPAAEDPAGGEAKAADGEEGGDVGAPSISVPLKALPEGIQQAIYVNEQWPVIVSPDGCAAQFLKYQSGAFLRANDPRDMSPPVLRRALVGGLRYGNTLSISFDSFDDIDVTRYFDETYFPEQVLQRSEIFKEEVWSKLLRSDEGDPDPIEFFPRDEFVFCIVVKSEEIPPHVRSRLTPVYISDHQRPAGGGEGEGGTGAEGEGGSEGGGKSIEAVIAEAYGAVEKHRNSKDLVEAAFDGEMDEVKNWIDKGYAVDSEDGRQHTALSEASCQGHVELVQFLLGSGADPNKLSDTGRSPVWRAAFNGHTECVRVLLEAGGDPDVKERTSMDGPYDVAKTDAVRELLESWDRGRTATLKEERAAAIRAALDERIKTAAEREAHARHLLRTELCELAEKGDVDALKTQLETLANEADMAGERPRASADARNGNGLTLLGIATQHGHMNVVEMLLTHWKSCDEDRWDLMPGEMSTEAKIFRANVNARDMKGWNVAAIAVFHNQVNILRLLLEHGADPHMKSHYHQSAYDLSQDETDAAGKVTVSKHELRAVIEEHERNNNLLRDKSMRAKDGSDCNPSELPDEGSAVALNIEMNKELEAGAAAEAAAAATTEGGGATKKKKKKGSGGGRGGGGGSGGGRGRGRGRGRARGGGGRSGKAAA